MTSSLYHFCDSVFLFVSEIKLDHEDKTKCTQEEAFRLLDRFSQQARSHGHFTENIEKAKYALAALCDEIAIVTDWPGKKEWMKRPLQLKLFNEHLSGENFFKNLDEIKKQQPMNDELLMVYWICLKFGFRGKFRNQAEKEFQLYLDSLSRLIRKPSLHYPPLFLEKPLEKKHGPRRLFFSAISLVFVFYLYCFFSVHVLSHGLAKHLIAGISQ